MVCSSAVLLCFVLSGCNEAEEKTDLDLIIADLSTSYLDDDTPEETTSLFEETEESEEASDEQLVLSAVTGKITDLSESDIYIATDEEKVIKFTYDIETSLYGTDALKVGQNITVTYRGDDAVAVIDV